MYKYKKSHQFSVTKFSVQFVSRKYYKMLTYLFTFVVLCMR